MATLAVKYRPQTFGDVVEQNVIKAILQNQIKDNAVKNCYLFCGPAGCGKAQPLYSKVLTPNGFITMGEVTTDTKVITRNGNVTDVVNVYPQGIRKVYEIRLSDGTAIRVADNHLNSVYIYNDKAQRKDLVLETTSLINLMDSISNRVYVDIPVVYFNEESNNYKGAYELGLKLGNLNNTNKTLDFGIDEEFLLSAKKTRTALFDGIINSIYGKESTGNDRIAVIYSEVFSKDFEFLVRSLGYYDEVSVTTDKTYIHNIKRSSIRYITYIRYIGEEECQCIYVADSDHTYISDNFIPTHNTTNARLFAKEINGADGIITELDAASHNGVEDVRKLIEDSKFKPIGCKYRVYIIDECVTGDTEILTKDGWKRIDSISENEVVAQYVHDKGIEFVSIDEYIVKDYSGDMYEVSFGDNHSVTMSPHHVQVVIDSITHEISEEYIQDIDFTDKGIITINYDSDGSYGVGRYYSKNITKNKISNYYGKIYCVKVPSHMIILRVNGFAFVSGNCHALSNSAWQAMLKCLEEPTPTSINVFCTTDPQKIPATIISRIQRYDFQKITHAGIVNRLKYIISKENEEGCNYTYDEEAISYIAKLADGGMRDSITLLEKTLAYNPNVTMESVTKALGTVDYNVMFDLTDAICKMDKKSVIEIIEGIHRDGLDLKQFIKNYNYFVLDLCKYDILREFEYLQIPSVYSNRMKYSKEDYAFFTTLLNEVINLNSNIKWESTPKPSIDSTFILLCSEA